MLPHYAGSKPRKPGKGNVVIWFILGIQPALRQMFLCRLADWSSPVSDFVVRFFTQFADGMNVGVHVNTIMQNMKSLSFNHLCEQLRDRMILKI